MDARDTSKNTIYAGDSDLPTLYDEWKGRLLRTDYNWHLKQAEGMGRTVPMTKAAIPKGVASTSVPTQKTPSGTTYGGQGAPMDISAAAATSSATDAERSVTLNVTAPTHRKPGRKLCIDSTLTGTTIQR